MARIAPVDAVEHVGELRRRDGERSVSRRRPYESTALQPLRVQRHADPVMPNDFNQVAPGTSENVKIAGVRIAPAPPPPLQPHPFHAFALARPPTRNPPPTPRGTRNHRPPSTRRTT